MTNTAKDHGLTAKHHATGLDPAQRCTRPHAVAGVRWPAGRPRARTVEDREQGSGTGVAVVLSDSFGRIATDLRVSVTDRCNLRCSYCLPPEGLDWLPRPALLTDDEGSPLMSVAVQRLGVPEVRVTGGQP